MTNTTSIISSINFINTVLVPAMEMTKAMYENGFRSHVTIPLKDVLTPAEQEAVIDSWECALQDDLWNAGATNRDDGGLKVMVAVRVVRRGSHSVPILKAKLAGYFDAVALQHERKES